MIIANFVSNPPTMGDTRTYEDFYKFLGKFVYAQVKSRELLESHQWSYNQQIFLGKSAAAYTFKRV